MTYPLGRDYACRHCGKLFGDNPDAARLCCPSARPALCEWSFDAYTELVVIGTHPEMADYDNRRGDIYGYAGYVRAINDNGDTRIQHIATDPDDAVALGKASRQAAALNARFANGKLPVAFADWQRGRAVYGSRAYEQYGAAEQLAFERNE